MSKELWMLVAGDKPCPDNSDKDAKLKWKKRAQKAAGELFLSVDQDQKSHFHGILSDPISHLDDSTQCPHVQETRSTF